MAAFSPGCSRRPAATQIGHAGRTRLVPSFIFLFLPGDHEKPRFVPLPCLPLSLFIHFSRPFLPPIYPPLRLTCLTAEESERRKKEEKDKGEWEVKNESGVRKGSAPLLPCHANGFQIRLHITPRREPVSPVSPNASC